jgi:hypothetical protein
MTENKKYYKVWDAYNGFCGKKETYSTLTEAEDAAKIRSQSTKGQYDVIIFEAIGQVKVPVPNLEIIKYT